MDDIAYMIRSLEYRFEKDIKLILVLLLSSQCVTNMRYTLLAEIESIAFAPPTLKKNGCTVLTEIARL